MTDDKKPDPKNLGHLAADSALTGGTTLAPIGNGDAAHGLAPAGPTRRLCPWHERQMHEVLKRINLLLDDDEALVHAGGDLAQAVNGLDLSL